MTSAIKENRISQNINAAGLLYLLPSNTLKIIVQYRPHWKISCVLPPDTKTVKMVDWYYDPDDHNNDENDDEDEDREPTFTTREAKTLVPSLLFTHNVHLDHYKNAFAGGQFFLNAIDLTKEDKLWITPYGFSNVANDGSVCFGSAGRPSNLRAANIVFWESPFNADYSQFGDEHRAECKSVVHGNYGHQSSKCCPNITKHACKCNKRHQHTHAAKYEKSCDCCSKRCECSVVHKMLCACRREITCLCVCADEDCEHCTKTCSCTSSCDCQCCYSECDCECKCNKNEVQIAYVQDYATKVGKQGWLNGVNVYCGEGFLSSPTKANGVFFSFNKEFLDTIPKNLWRKSATAKPVAIGFANKCPDTDEWELTFGKHVCVVSTKQLSIC